MLRITVFGRNLTWTFKPGAEPQAEWKSALGATHAAVEFGEEQVGFSAGYIISLAVPCDFGEPHSMVIESRVFDSVSPRAQPSAIAAHL